MRLKLSFALLTLAVVLAACGSSGSPAASSGGAPGGAAAATVTITDAAFPGRFEPGTVNIKVGQSVHFTSQSTVAHSVKWNDSGIPTSGIINQGDAGYTTPVFTTAGTFAYICGIHGASMSGTIVVQP